MASSDLSIDLSKKGRSNFEWNCCMLSNAGYRIFYVLVFEIEMGVEISPLRHGASCQEARHGTG